MGDGGRIGARGRVLLAAAALVLLAGCDSMNSMVPSMPKLPDVASWSCNQPGETSMVVAHLYMGGKVPGGAFIGEFEWQQFVAASVVPRFPSGVMSSDVSLNYMSSAGAGALQDNTKLLTIMAASGDETENKLNAVAAEFRRKFPKQAVTLVESNECVQTW
jgi:hypothetical protein